MLAGTLTTALKDVYFNKWMNLNIGEYYKENVCLSSAEKYKWLPSRN
jgi:hypothetical protein